MSGSKCQIIRTASVSKLVLEVEEDMIIKQVRTNIYIFFRYNSRINKLISCIHPNPWILLCTVTQELLKAEPDALWIKDGNPSRKKVNAKYQQLIDKREELMERYSKNDIDEDFYLQRMGALSLKLARVAKKTTVDAEVPEATSREPGGNGVGDGDESNDSLSETRAMPHSDDSCDSFSDNDHNYGTDALNGVAQRLLNKRNTGKKQTSKNLSQ